MSKKKNKNVRRDPTPTSVKAYELHTEAVERLATADESAPEVDEKEIKKYRKGFLYRVPMWAKALFVKFWFNGAVCYFFVWGLGFYIQNSIDILIVLALAMGAFNSLIVNNVLLFLDDGGNGYSKWLFIPQLNFDTTSKKLWWSIGSFFLDLIYASLVVFIVYLIYYGANKAASGAIGVEPLSFGLLYLAVDLIFIGMKFLAVRIVKDALTKNR